MGEGIVDIRQHIVRIDDACGRRGENSDKELRESLQSVKEELRAQIRRENETTRAEIRRIVDALATHEHDAGSQVAFRVPSVPVADD